jgi:hypothetical protein
VHVPVRLRTVPGTVIMASNWYDQSNESALSLTRGVREGS